MWTLDTHQTISPGDAAPDFTLPLATGEGTVSLADYRGRSALFLGLFIGLWCPFCRRAVAKMGQTGDKLRPLGVESLAVVASAPDNARLYFKFRPTRLQVACDPGLDTHRAYRVPSPAPTEEMTKEMETVRINPTGELPEPRPVREAAEIAGRFDGYKETEADKADIQRQWTQLKGEFLIDREGVVRWTFIECAKEGLAGIGMLASEEEILAAARAL